MTVLSQWPYLGRKITSAVISSINWLKTLPTFLYRQRQKPSLSLSLSLSLKTQNPNLYFLSLCSSMADSVISVDKVKAFLQSQYQDEEKWALNVVTLLSESLFSSNLCNISISIFWKISILDVDLCSFILLWQGIYSLFGCCEKTI